MAKRKDVLLQHDRILLMLQVKGPLSVLQIAQIIESPITSTLSSMTTNNTQDRVKRVGTVKRTHNPIYAITQDGYDHLMRIIGPFKPTET